MIVAMSINEAYLGTNRTNPFSLPEVWVEWDHCVHVAGTPISTTDNKRIFYKTLIALDFVLKTGHGINFANYDNHYFMAFDLTSTQEASHNFIHPELTNCTISVHLKFDAGLGNNVELLFMGERASAFYLRLDRKNNKNHS